MPGAARRRTVMIPLVVVQGLRRHCAVSPNLDRAAKELHIGRETLDAALAGDPLMPNTIARLEQALARKAVEPSLAEAQVTE
jgi:hypothetical protein